MKKIFIIFLLLTILLTQLPIASVFAQAGGAGGAGTGGAGAGGAGAGGAGAGGAGAGGAGATNQKYTSKCLSQAFSTLLSDVLSDGLDSLTGKLSGIDTSVPAKDDASQLQIKAFQFDACIQSVLESAAKIAMAKLKKKLMDDIVMQTTQWIQDDKEPKFITNYNDFLSESKDIALENVMREIDLSSNPDKQFLDALKEGLKRKINGQDQVPLNKKVSNIASAGEIQSLRDDFIAGGGIAKLQELMTDKNPEFVLDEVIQVTAERIDNEQTKQDKNTDGLARATLECQTWVLVNKTTNQKLYASGQGSYALNASGQRQIAATDPRALNNPPAAPNPGTQEYICLNDPTQTGVALKTDPTLIKDVAKTTLIDQGFNSIISSDDLSDYISQITDSVFFRFQKEGLRMFDTAKGSVQKGLWPDNGNYLSQETYSGQSEVENIQNNQVVQEEINEQISTDLKQRTEKIISDASSSVKEVRSLDAAPMHRIKYLDWLLNATTTPTGGILNCRIDHPFFIGILQQPYPDQIPLSSQIRPNNQAFIPVFNSIYTNGQTLLTRVLAINPQTNAETIATLKNDVLTAENNIKTKIQDFSDFKTQLQSYIAATNANWPICNHTSKESTPKEL